MVHVPAKFRENTAMHFFSNHVKSKRDDGQTNGFLTLAISLIL